MKEQCPRCLEKGWPGWLDRHRVKAHRQCPLCPRAMVGLVRHLQWHYWQTIEPMVRSQVESAPLVEDVA